ncbi:hypothetical protein LCGC14_2444230, partial [marine sediment metagenome]
YSETDFEGEFETSADYRDPYVEELIKEKGWMFWAPIRYSYDTINYDLPSPAPSPPSKENLLGTDDKGRDVMARLIFGFRISVLFGLSLTFEAKTMDAMPEGPAQALIAHELAHVLQCLENTDLKSDGSKLDPVEVDAWVRVVHWGFDLDLYEDWSANNSPPSPDVTALP